MRDLQGSIEYEELLEERPHKPAPGKVTLSGRLRRDGEPAAAEVAPHPLAMPLQRRQAGRRSASPADDPFALHLAGPGDDAADPHAVAAAGTAGGGQPLPYLDQIQASFGRHDVSGVSAHQGDRAERATRALGAQAYARGDDVVLGAGGTDLHTVAHEAAHVVQQRGGVALKSGLGEAGDRHEQHADAVADLVVQGRSAEGLLDLYAGGADGAAGGGAVQALQLATLQGAGARWEVRVDQVVPAGGRPPTTSGVILYSATAGATVSSTDVETGIGLPAGSLVAAEPMRCYDGAAVAAFAPARGRAAEAGGGQPAETAGARPAEAAGGAPAGGPEGAARPAREGGGGDVIAQVRAWIAERDLRGAEEPDDAWAPFTAAFNTEFAPILAELGAGPDGFTSEQLQGMFTARQRELMQQYLTPAHTIPEGLFNGGERGGATAQQRILMSSHMLVNGNYQHREDGGRREPEGGRVHAGSCGHWARLVLDYAGAAPDHGAGLPNVGPDYGYLRNEDDTTGGALDRGANHGRGTAGSAPAGYTDEPPPAGLTADQLEAWERRNRDREALAGERIPRERLDDLQAGDWLYIFNDQGRRDRTSRGQHSVIFLRWIERPRERDGYYYGRALTQDQLSPSEGGATHELNLGDHYRDTRPRIFPVTRVTRVTADTGPARPEASEAGPPPGD
ncbi:MAG: DUF4157 domain-containing protein [Kofleriaceae bacterium]|nr:DUF4157 domain-containing protein [Kofleriaceae bacterium]MCL4226340.1 DUF4157 domain-containing protein [Myxococcales bacterium]